jgi:hypothetical protein
MDAVSVDNNVKERTDEKIDETSGKFASKLLMIGGNVLGFIVYFGMAFPLNNLIGNMIRVGNPVSTPANTLMAGQNGGKYGVYEPLSENFLSGVFESIQGAVISCFLLIFMGGPIYALVLFYFALRLIGIEKQPCCAKDGKTDLTRTSKFLCCLFPVGCLLGIGVIILYVNMYFTFDVSFNIIFGISCK